MKAFKRLLQASFVFFVATGITRAEPGGWESSGGEVFRFAKNPWFVRNTEEVKYCFQHDASGFSASLEVAKSAFDEALAYWKKEFAQNVASREQGMFATLASQNFVLEECKPSTDLVIKLGAGNLNPTERDHLKDFRTYIGVSVRTQYDLANMKGRGFVFIASDQGPEAYHNPGHLIDRAWQHPALLKYIFLHELGHIFGLPHSGASLMAEVFPDLLLNKNIYRSYLTLEPPSIFGTPRPVKVCAPLGSFDAGFFQIPTDVNCMRVIPTAADPLVWEIWAQQNGQDQQFGVLRVQMP
ncbi:MAG: hypothetical protein AB7F86_18135, partial [Bdellovibrionales bacterium]